MIRRLFSFKPMCFVIGILVLFLCVGVMAGFETWASEKTVLKWKNYSSTKGDIPVPGSTQQTACQVLDIDKDGVDDFVIGCRKKPPAMTWFKRSGEKWKKFLIDGDLLPIEAGGAFEDIDGDGDLDIVMGEDASGNKMYWWENPYPNYEPDVPWKRYIIKNSGANKHHDQIFGDFDGDGKPELFYWNNRAFKLFFAEIPGDPKNTQPWPAALVYTAESESEGLARCDINGDGKIDLIGGGRWFEHQGGNKFKAHIVDDTQRFTRSGAGQLVIGGWGEIVFVVGDGVGRMKWYEIEDNKWTGHDLLGFDVDHGHSLVLADMNQDGNLDIFCGEMRLNNGNEDAGMWVFLGDGRGNFTKTEVASGYGVHEAHLGDLDGDGDLDICAKPYNWNTPRLDVWLNVQ